MKKLIAFVCAMALLLSVSCIAFADTPTNLALTAVASSNIPDSDAADGKIIAVNDGDTGTAWQFGSQDKLDENYSAEANGQHDVTLSWRSAQTIRTIVIIGDTNALLDYDGTTDGGYYFTYTDQSGTAHTVTGGTETNDEGDPATRVITFDDPIEAMEITIVAVSSDQQYLPKYREIEVYGTDYEAESGDDETGTGEIGGEEETPTTGVEFAFAWVVVFAAAAAVVFVAKKVRA